MKKLLLDPDPRLRKVCAEVSAIDGYIKSLASELFQLIDKIRTEGKVDPIGLAAPQLGELVQLFVIDTPAFKLVMINPRPVKLAGVHRLQEGCLSLPGRLFITERPKVVKIRGLTLEGEERSVKVHDELAQAMMHEMEHLQGIMVDNVALVELEQK